MLRPQPRCGSLAAVGGTPVVELQRIVPPGCACVLVKLESDNPTGRTKDRMALAVVNGAFYADQFNNPHAAAGYVPLAREEALFADTSTGANVVAALRIAQRLGPGRTVATLACDSGLSSCRRIGISPQPCALGSVDI